MPPGRAAWAPGPGVRHRGKPSEDSKPSQDSNEGGYHKAKCRKSMGCGETVAAGVNFVKLSELPKKNGLEA